MRFSPCRFDGSFAEPFWVWDRELVSCGNPFSDGPYCLLRAVDSEIDQLCRSFIGLKAAANFGCFAGDAVQVLCDMFFDLSIRRVQGLADQMHEAGLDGDIGKGRVDRTREPFEAVHDRY